MIEGSEELKMVLELAASKGRKEAENEMLETQKKQLEEANTKLLHHGLLLRMPRNRQQNRIMMATDLLQMLKLLGSALNSITIL